MWSTAVKLNAAELKQRLIEAWFGIQQSVADQVINMASSP